MKAELCLEPRSTPRAARSTFPNHMEWERLERRVAAQRKLAQGTSRPSREVEFSIRTRDDFPITLPFALAFLVGLIHSVRAAAQRDGAVGVSLDRGGTGQSQEQGHALALSWTIPEHTFTSDQYCCQHSTATFHNPSGCSAKRFRSARQDGNPALQLPAGRSVAITRHRAEELQQLDR